MKDAKKFRRYAEECRRLAKQMRPEHRVVLLRIAEAWERCAEEAEGANGRSDGLDGVEAEPPRRGGGRRRLRAVAIVPRAVIVPYNLVGVVAHSLT
jgi:hypothetical protein